MWIAPGRGGAKVEGLAVQTFDSSDLQTTLAGLRARAAGRQSIAPKACCASSTNSRTVLKTPHFGVAVWGGDGLDSLSIEMLQGLVLDLNKTTRFSGLPLGVGANAAGVVQTSGWMTGFPVRTSFGRGFPEHDTWRFDSTRLIESGEADAALWISAYGGEAPPWKKHIPLVALASPQTAFAREPQVCIEVGCPGLITTQPSFPAKRRRSLAARRRIKVKRLRSRLLSAKLQITWETPEC